MPPFDTFYAPKINFQDVYHTDAAVPSTQDTSNGASPARDTTATVPAPTASLHVAISWIGVIVALILLRIIYEVAE